MVGIYRIKNLITGESYIGQSTDIDKRWKVHKQRVKNTQYNTKLYNAIRKYGIENFSFSIIKICKPSQLNLYEKTYIKVHNTIENGYNEITNTNSGNRIGAKETKIKKELERERFSMREIADKFQVSYSTVNQINRGVMFFDIDRDYPIRETSRTKKIIGA